MGLKRALAMLLTVALVGSLTFAGSAAAIDIELEQEADIDQDADAETEQYQSVSQDNTANQGGNIAIGGTAANTADQSNTNVQYAETEAENDADVDQDVDEFEVDDNVLLDF